jgi:CheY-like chemotaxis protein
MEIRVMIADDHRILREGLRSLLHEHPGVAVVAEAEDGRSAVHCAEESQPDIAIVDVTMPGLNGIEATRQIRAVSPATKVIALTMHAEKQFVTEMLKAGASAYVLKDSARISPASWWQTGCTPLRRQATQPSRRSPRASAKCCNCWPRATPPSRSHGT